MAWLWGQGQLLGIVRALSPAPHGPPCLLQQPPLTFPLSCPAQPFTQFGLTLGGYCSLTALWWGHGSHWPGFAVWLSLPSRVPQDWALNPLSPCFFSTMPGLAPTQDGPGTRMGQHVLAVSRAVESCVRAGLWLLLRVRPPHHCPLPEGRGHNT